MDRPTLRKMTTGDAPAVIMLNAGVAHASSPMGREQFDTLFALCDLKLVAQLHGEVVAFILGLAHNRRVAPLLEAGSSKTTRGSAGELTLQEVDLLCPNTAGLVTY